MTAPGGRVRRLDQLLARCGYGSRREVSAWVRGGRVTWRGEVVADPGAHVDPADLRVDGEPVEAPEGLLAMLHKPAGLVCSHDGREGPSIYDLLPGRWGRRNPPVASVGRLDKETTGLVLVTDLGDLIHRWTSPRRHVEKVYEVEVEGTPPADLAARFDSGEFRLRGEERPCLPARLEWTGPGQGRLYLREGRYHQVRRMFAEVGLTVVRLHRPRFGPYELGDLPVGAWRRLPLPGAASESPGPR